MTDYKLVPVGMFRDAVRAVRDLHWQKKYNSVQEGDAEHAKRLDRLVYDMLVLPDVQGGPVAWSGWGCQYPGKMPRLYGDRHIAELNCDWENGDQLLYFTADPQPVEQQPVQSVIAQIIGLIDDECRYWHGRDEIRRGCYANLRAKVTELVNKQNPAADVTQLVEALARCRHEASYSIGGEDALRIQLEKVRDIVNQTLSALTPYRKGGDES